MSWIWPILAVLAIFMWVWALIDIIRRRGALSGFGVAGWIVVVLVFPVLGAAAYFIVRAVQEPRAALVWLKVAAAAIAYVLFAFLGIFLFGAIWLQVGFVAAVVVIFGGLLLVSNLVEKRKKEKARPPRPAV